MVKVNQELPKESYVPSEIWMLIISKLPLRSICHIRGVSKTWYNLISELFSVKLFNVKSLPTNLVILGRKSEPSQNLFMAEFHVTRDHTSTSLEVYDLHCAFGPVASCNGLVLLISFYHLNPFTYWISNPIIGQYMKLPFPKDNKGRRDFCGFGFCPSSKQYKVIQFHYLEKGKENEKERKSTLVEIHTLGTYTWRETQIVPPKLVDEHVKTYGHVGTYSNGSLYWMEDYIVYRFDLENERFSSIDSPEFKVIRNCKFYGETNGKLYVSVHCDGVLDVFFQKDLGWDKVHSISIPDVDGFPEHATTAVFADSKDIIALGYYDTESLEFYLMAWDLKVDNENVVGVENVRSSFYPITYVPNFTSLCDVIAGEAYQLNFRHLTKNYLPCN